MQPAHRGRLARAPGKPSAMDRKSCRVTLFASFLLPRRSALGDSSRPTPCCGLRYRPRRAVLPPDPARSWRGRGRGVLNFAEENGPSRIASSGQFDACRREAVGRVVGKHHNAAAGTTAAVTGAGVGSTAAPVIAEVARTAVTVSNSTVAETQPCCRSRILLLVGTVSRGLHSLCRGRQKLRPPPKACGASTLSGPNRHVSRDGTRGGSARYADIAPALKGRLFAGMCERGEGLRGSGCSWTPLLRTIRRKASWNRCL